MDLTKRRSWDLNLPKYPCDSIQFDNIYMTYNMCPFAFRLHASISKQVDKMNRVYEELEAIQADAVANTMNTGLLSLY